MSGRAYRRIRALAALVTGLAILAAPADARGTDAAEASAQAPPLEDARGSGYYSPWVERLACVGCIGAVYYAAAGTPLGFLLVSIIRPEAILGCGWICYTAVT